MAEELGQIPKMEVESFGEGRKLLLVPLMFAPMGAPDDLAEKVARYWDEVESHISNLEAKLGSVVKVFHELVPIGDEAGRTAMEELNKRSYEIVKRRLDEDARLELVEDIELLTEFMDWSRCLAIGLQNPKVMAKVHESYLEVHKKRNEDIAGKIDAALEQGEVGMLLIREGHQVQFPQDIQVFYVAPPSLEDVKRWLRDREQELMRQQAGQAEGEEQGNST